MAKMYITEYERIVETANGRAVMGMEPAVATQAVTFTTSVASAAFNARTKFVRIQCDGIASIFFGTAPVATTDHPRMTAGQTEYFGVTPGGGLKVAAVTNT